MKMKGLFFRDTKKGRKWGYKIEMKGHKSIKQTVGFDKEETKTARMRALLELKDNKPVSPQKLTFEEFALGKYINYCKLDKKSWGSYEATINFVMPYLRGKSFEQITPEVIKDLMQKLGMRRGRKPETKISMLTIKNHLDRISNIFTRAKELGYFNGNNPVRKVLKEPKKKKDFEKDKTRSMQYLKDASQQEKLLRKCYEKDKLIGDVVVFALNTGCRLNEIILLKWEDLDFTRKTIRIIKTNTKTNQERYNQMNIQLENLLRSMAKEKIAKKIESPLVFCDEKIYDKENPSWQDKRKIYNYVRHNFYKIRGNIKGLTSFRFHDLRHSFATKMVDEGINIYVISKMLGHSTVKTTEIYAHVSDKKKAEAVSKLDDIYPDIDGIRNKEKVAGGISENRTDSSNIVNNSEISESEVIKGNNRKT